MPELDDYEEAIEFARKECSELAILKGMECEYVEEFHSYLQDDLLGERGFNYLIEPDITPHLREVGSTPLKN
jgi:histidinol phosphatase-like PHP family hydrolase